MIGDPSGKSSERQLLDEETIQKNTDGIRKNIEKLLCFEGENGAIILNNYDWFKEFSFVSFLRDVGKYFRVGSMLAKESVKARLSSEEGMSFTEFSYQLLQGYDFLHLFQTDSVLLQIGGSDQWGNITAGTELIRKVTGKTAYGLTFPLLTRSDGQKFGKSEKGAIWLSPERLPAYDFYQYLVRVADADVINLMRLLTCMEMNEILQYAESLKTGTHEPNAAQKRLAEEVTRMLHGEEGLKKALQLTLDAAPGSKTVLNAQTLETLVNEMPSKSLPLEDLMHVALIDIIASIGLLPSKGEARRFLRNGGIYLNNEKVEDENLLLTPDNLIDGKFLLLAAGKKNKIVIKAVP